MKKLEDAIVLYLSLLNISNVFVRVFIPLKHSYHCLLETTFNFLEIYKNMLVVMKCFHKVVFYLYFQNPRSESSGE